MYAVTRVKWKSTLDLPAEVNWFRGNESYSSPVEAQGRMLIATCLVYLGALRFEGLEVRIHRRRQLQRSPDTIRDPGSTSCVAVFARTARMQGFVLSCAALPTQRHSCGGAACARTPPVMKAKGGKRKSKSVKAAAKAAKSPEGFGKPPPVAEKESGDDELVMVDDVDGSIGDSTPKRAYRPSGRAQLADPLKEAALMEDAASDVDDTDGDEAMAVEVARLAAVRARAEQVAAVRPDPELRWPWDTSNDAAVEMLAVARKDGCLDEVVVSNRDFVSQRMLYRFTSAILQAEGEGAEDEARNMRTLRTDVIDVCWHADRPLRDELFHAEARLVQVLQAPEESNTLGEVEARAGVTGMQVNAFWLVVYGAVAAWEVRERAGTQDKEDAQADIQLRLKNVAAALNNSRVVARALSPALAAAGRVLTAAKETEQAAAIADLDDATVAEMRITLEQVRLWPQNAYGPFTNKLQSIVDYAVVAVGSVAEVERTIPFRFKPVEIERTSRLVDFTNRNAKSRTTSFSPFGGFR